MRPVLPSSYLSLSLTRGFLTRPDLFFVVQVWTSDGDGGGDVCSVTKQVGGTATVCVCVCVCLHTHVCMIMHVRHISMLKLDPNSLIENSTQRRKPDARLFGP